MIRTITYRRVINLGDYESKALELTYEIEEYDDQMTKISEVMEAVEWKLREDQTKPVTEEIASLRHELRKLKTEHRELLNQINGDTNESNDDN